MAFDIGAGLAAMGTSLSKSAGLAALESQRAELEQQKLELVDRMATRRDEANRAFTTSERLGAEAHQSQEKAADRASDLEGRKISASATVSAASISAAASRYASDNRIREAEMQIAALAPGREADTAKTRAETSLLEGKKDLLADAGRADIEKTKADTDRVRAEATAKVIAADALKAEETAKKNLADVVNSGDQGAIKKAQGEYAIATLNNSEQVKAATSMQALAEGYRKELDAGRAALTQLEKSNGALARMPDVLASIEQKKAEVASAERNWRRYATEAEKALAAIPKMPGLDDANTGAPSVLRYDAQGRRIGSDGRPIGQTAPAPVTGAPKLQGKGLIDTYPGAP